MNMPFLSLCFEDWLVNSKLTNRDHLICIKIFAVKLHPGNWKSLQLLKEESK